MKSPESIQKLYRSESKKWIRDIEMTIKVYQKRYPFVQDSIFYQKLWLKLHRKRELIIGVWSTKHPNTDGFYYNHYLSDLFAQARNAHMQYGVLPIGHFFNHNYPKVRAKHLVESENTPIWYGYRKEAFNWGIPELIKWYSLYAVLDDMCYVNEPIASYNPNLTPNTHYQPPNTQEITTNTPQKQPQTPNKHPKSVLNERSGLMHQEEVARLLDISTRTVRRKANSGELPHIKEKNGRYVFKRKEITKYFDTLKSFSS